MCVMFQRPVAPLSMCVVIFKRLLYYRIMHPVEMVFGLVTVSGAFALFVYASNNQAQLRRFVNLVNLIKVSYNVSIFKVIVILLKLSSV